MERHRPLLVETTNDGMYGTDSTFFDNADKQPVPRKKYTWPRFIFRRIVFYVYLFTFVFAIGQQPQPDPPLLTNLTFWTLAAHILYFELDPDVKKHTWPVRFLHAISFGGSILVASLFILLIAFLDPTYMERGAARGKISLAMAYAITSWLHFMPPIFHAFDIFSSRHRLRARHNLTTKSLPKFALKVTWLFLSPMILSGVWVAVGFTPMNVYHTDKNYWEEIVITGLCAAIISAVIMVLVLKKRSDIDRKRDEEEEL